MSHKVFSLSYGITTKAAFGKKWKDQEAFRTIVTKEMLELRIKTK
ncbi:hypothetical protein Godav_001248 [Gossypium davidsonii]|uniref:Uncharacterized protein n=1 Tax=Gossypium davidsonii TaxID=34287 RepID=A0A7J8T2B5_GOSDV|nr:hypothetical protein [Gossypium davidsonii]